jgi:DNA-binding Lrp family transcriptional regulator
MVNFLESVFDNTAEIHLEYPAEMHLEKPKRSAFVFINAESESGQYALEDLKKIAQVQEAYLAKGAYDIVAKLSGESFDELKEIVHTKISAIDDVKSTLTLTII